MMGEATLSTLTVCGDVVRECSGDAPGPQGLPWRDFLHALHEQQEGEVTSQ